MVQDVAKRAEAVRDLRGQIAELSQADAAEIMFIDASPQRRKVTIYSMLNGEPIAVPVYMVDTLMQQTLPAGGFAFTSDPDKAPVYKLGDVKCFLHPDSPDRPILREIGMGGAFCPAPHLANEHEKRMHALHKHRKQWEAYQEYLEDEKRKKTEDRQDRQLEATLEIARAAAGSPQQVHADSSSETTVAVVEAGAVACEVCGRDFSDKKRPGVALASHRRAAGHNASTLGETVP